MVSGGHMTFHLLDFRTPEVTPWHSLLNMAGREDGQMAANDRRATILLFHLSVKMPLKKDSLLGLKTSVHGAWLCNF